VQESILDEFVAKFEDVAKQSIRLGDPLDPKTTMGPLVTKSHREHVLKYIELGEREGARKVFGGRSSFPRGWFVNPTLFVNVNNKMRIAQEEIFGPVACVIPFKTFEQAISLANDTKYGLAASIWTRDLTTAHKFGQQVRSGIVWINCYDEGDMTLPWGGYKQSGFGRDKCFDALTAHTQTKGLWMSVE
jgi:gamma-glutamyl-gamma-aminobutyraldehyde dehydrogenase